MGGVPIPNRVKGQEPISCNFWQVPVRVAIKKIKATLFIKKITFAFIYIIFLPRQYEYSIANFAFQPFVGCKIFLQQYIFFNFQQ